MAVTKVSIMRMTTSRDDDTKYEHFVTLHNDKGQAMSLWKHYNPMHALHGAIDTAAFLDVPMDPFTIDGVEQKLEGRDRLGLRFAPDENGEVDESAGIY